VEHSLATDIAICIIAAWVMAVLSQVAKQPLLLAYLAAGFAVGPNGFRLVTNPNSIQTISEIGLSLLLFTIGLEVDLKQILRSGRITALAAVAQVFGALALGWAVFGWLGPAQSRLETMYLAVAVAMSSTIIVVKILYDKRELETLAGRITLGVLVLQDMVTILFLAVQPNLKHPSSALLAMAYGKVVLLLVVAYLASRFVLPPVFRLVARLPELVLIGALAWCLSLVGFADWLGLSSAMGALIAGTMISTFPYTLDVQARVTSIRDFFVTLFFVGLGMSIPVPTVSYLLWTLLVCAVLVLTRFVTLFPVLYRLRQGYRMSFLPTVNLCQMSELSLVLLALGKKAGDVSDQVMGICAFSFAFLAVASTYAMLGSETLLRVATGWFRRLGLRDFDPERISAGEPAKTARISILGFSWTASSLLAEIERHRPDLLPDLCVIDFNPVVHERLKQRGVHAVYGDITARDTLQHAGIGRAELILCTLPNTLLKGADNLKLLRQLRELNPSARIVVHAERLSDVPLLYTAGASYVTVPRLLEATDLLQVVAAADRNVLEQMRQAQGLHLEQRNEIVH
jgi:Kef-type K+ transport system membrane component KefB